MYFNHVPLLQDFCSRGRLLYVDLHDKLICSQLNMFDRCRNRRDWKRQHGFLRLLFGAGNSFKLPLRQSGKLWRIMHTDIGDV